jgi:hypothetical protein
MQGWRNVLIHKALHDRVQRVGRNTFENTLIQRNRLAKGRFAHSRAATNDNEFGSSVIDPRRRRQKGLRLDQEKAFPKAVVIANNKHKHNRRNDGQGIRLQLTPLL